MTREEQLKQKEIELFVLQCKDHYDDDDWSTSNKLHEEIRKLREEIKNGRI